MCSIGMLEEEVLLLYLGPTSCRELNFYSNFLKYSFLQIFWLDLQKSERAQRVVLSSTYIFYVLHCIPLTSAYMPLSSPFCSSLNACSEGHFLLFVFMSSIPYTYLLDQILSCWGASWCFFNVLFHNSSLSCILTLYIDYICLYLIGQQT